ncbi:MAG TPA: hypothetical protein VHS52_05930 [Acidimicrobiales bacterium]|jgi:hypothetical protein|nr:hypothetical protein [Acidimicrobiales bacterium]
MAGFVQIIEIKTSRIDEIDALVEEAVSRGGSMPMTRATMTADRDRPGYYLSILEFDSYEQAMENSNSPETTEMSAKMASLCDGPPTFYNLDVRRVAER